VRAHRQRRRGVARETTVVPASGREDGTTFIFPAADRALIRSPAADARSIRASIEARSSSPVEVPQQTSAQRERARTNQDRQFAFHCVVLQDAEPSSKTM
jgi:hypothetical protein